MVLPPLQGGTLESIQKHFTCEDPKFSKPVILQSKNSVYSFPIPEKVLCSQKCFHFYVLRDSDLKSPVFTFVLSVELPKLKCNHNILHKA